MSAATAEDVDELRASEQTAKAREIAEGAILLHPNLTTALLAAINELGVIGKSRTADAGTYSYDYADLEAVVAEVKRVLSKHGLAVRTPVHGHPDGLAVTVKFLHVSGETLDDEPLPFPRGSNAQASGSAMTYFRRYALLSSLNLATGQDDDGAKASEQPAFVWTQGAVKARLVELLGDKAAAKEAWTTGGGDNEPPSAELADRLAAEWRENQPKEPAADPVVAEDGDQK